MATQILVRAPLELKSKISQKANGMGLTVNALILQILWDWISQHDTSNTTQN